MDDAKNPFELNIENSNMLPIDQSLHAFMLQLNEGRAEKDQLTAKLVCNALGAVPKESDQAAPEDSIYQDVFKNKYDYEDESGRHTYPIPIFWETQDLFRAICKGRKQNRKLKDEPLAKAALEFLIDDLKKRNPTTVRGTLPGFSTFERRIHPFQADRRCRRRDPNAVGANSWPCDSSACESGAEADEIGIPGAG